MSNQDKKAKPAAPADAKKSTGAPAPAAKADKKGKN